MTAATKPIPLQPSPHQLARQKARQRFNWLYVYLPLGFVVLLWVTAILGLFWLTIAGDWFAMDTNEESMRQTISGVADFVTIFAIAPWLIVCALPTILPIALVINQRQKAKAKAEQGEPEKLPIFWRIENQLTNITSKIESVLPKVARPVITLNATIAFIQGLFRALKRQLTELTNNDRNN